MIRPATLILFALAVVAGGVLFSVAFEVSALEERLVVLNKEIAQDRDAVHVLRAEWSYLNQPERLEGLSRRYLELQPLEGGQMAEVASLPKRPLPEPDLAAESDTGDTGPAELQASELTIARTLNAKPKVKPTAPRRPSSQVRLASQRVSVPKPTGNAASDTAALNATLRAILGSTAGSNSGRSR